MATYNKIQNLLQDKEINYLGKDYQSFKNRLLEFAEAYFPETFNDFSENNPAMMFLEMAAYVGDVLSFYTDTQIQETFLSLAKDAENLYNISYAMGYKPKATAASFVNLSLSHLIPSKITTDSEGNTIYSPDYSYALKVGENSTFTSTEGPSFYMTEEADFGFSSSFSPVSQSIYKLDSSNNPQYYLLTKNVPAISGEIKTQEFTIGGPERFKTLTLFDDNIISIESIIDTEGNRYHEVPYLAQDTIFEEVNNTNANDPLLPQYNNQTPYLLKLRKTPRRFITRLKPDKSLLIQFGAGISDKSDELIIPNPDNVGLGIKDGRSKLNQNFDPSNFLYTKTYGQAPANTTLTVTYIVGGGIRSNVSSNTIVLKDQIFTSTKPNLDNAMANFVKTSLTSTNIFPSTGGGAGDTLEDIRLNTIANFSTQGRTVTKEDYIVRSLSMPAKFGSIAKAYIVQDDQLSPLTTEPNRIPNPLALNLYTLGYDSTRKLTVLNPATKTNLATYLDEFRSMTDAVNIKDAFIVNFSVDFQITVFKNFQNNVVLLNCIQSLKEYFSIDKWQINQPIIISEVKSILGNVQGVQTVEDVFFTNKFGALDGYSVYSYDLSTAEKNGVIYPSLDPCIFEIRFPNQDIQGQVTTY